MSDIKCPFSVKLLEKVEIKKGCWKVSKVGIFQDDKQIGEYVRNYESYIEATFCPFLQDGKWYALYSPNYTVTRLMSLPDCKDIGGEVDEKGIGFCPTNFYIPELCIQKIKYPEPRIDEQKWQIVTDHVSKSGQKYKAYGRPDDTNLEWVAVKKQHNIDWAKWMNEHPFVTEHAKFAFVSGCIWGDDTSWKVEFIDLSKVSEGIITRDNRFGYIELPPKVKLQDAIEVYQETDKEEPRIEIALPVKFKFDGSKIIDKE